MRIESIEIFVYLLFDIFESFVAYNFFKHFFNIKKNWEKHIALIYVFRYLVSSFTYLFFRATYLNFSISIFLFVILTIPYSAKIKQKLTIALFYFIMGMAADILLTIVLSFLMRVSMAEVLQPSMINIVGIISSKLTLAFFCTVALKILQRRRYYNLSSWYWAAIIFVPFGSVIMIHTFFKAYGNIASSYALVIMITFLTAVNFFIFFVYDKILEKYMVENENQLLSKQIEYYNYQFEQIKSSQATMSKIKHDIEKHLLGISINIKNGKTNEALEFVDSVLNNLHMGEGPANSGNTNIDAILNYKANAANEYGIQTVCDLQLPYMLDLNTTDMAVILGNAIDNAIEACKPVTFTSKTINIAVKYEQMNLYISIINPFAGILKHNAGRELSTTKKDSLFHGIGLKSIREIVERYDGIMDISAEDNQFVLKIILFNVSECQEISYVETATVP